MEPSPKGGHSQHECSLTSPITLIELREAMHSLPIGKAPGTDGFQVDFFLALWKTLGSDLLEACQEALRLGILHRELNTGTLYLIPKDRQVYCKTACRQNPTLIDSAHTIQSNMLHERSQHH
jgi:hypothetical protein